jgi:hypothetical protein
MTAGHILKHYAPGRRVKADLRRKHRKWPLGTNVMVQTREGYLRGRIHKHWRIDETRHGASVEFPFCVDMGDANGSRYCHEFPFRSMKPVPPIHPYGRTDDGRVIVAPAGWRLLREFDAIPQVHRVCDEKGQWLAPRRGHGTMTPLMARTWGYMRAFAVPVEARA